MKHRTAALGLTVALLSCSANATDCKVYAQAAYDVAVNATIHNLSDDELLDLNKAYPLTFSEYSTVVQDVREIATSTDIGEKTKLAEQFAADALFQCLSNQ